MSSQQSATDSTAVAQRKPKAAKPKRRVDKKPRRQPPYNVVLLDDNAHTYEYVIEMLNKLFGYDRTKAFNLATLVDYQGRAVVLTTTKEHAELKRDQIHAYGADFRLDHCEGSMSAVIEPAPS
jgi:ATP-dependent Clp protease adaptor protein ClpS